MIITKRHAILIKQLKDKWAQGLELDKTLDKLTDEDLEYLIHLDLAGLVEEVDNGYVLTQAGHLVSEAINECIDKAGNFQEWTDNFKFIGSEIISMIEIARQLQGDIERQPEAASELEARGLAEQGRLLPVAESILEAYDSAMPRISIGQVLMEKLRQCPPGPGKKSLLPFSREEIYELEAMRLISFSVPKGNSYSLTGSGQQIRAALIKGLSPGPVLKDDLLASSLMDNPDQKTKEKLQAAGAMDSSGGLLPAGRSLRCAARLLYVEPMEFIPAVSIDKTAFLALGSISELQEGNSGGTETAPDMKAVKKLMESRGISKTDTHRALLVLESYGLVKFRPGEEGKMVYEIESLGRGILKDRKRQDSQTVSARAVLAITTTRAENLSPDDSWIEMAAREGFIGKGFPAKSGCLFAEMAYNVRRMPLVDALDRKVLDVLPFWRGMFISQILELLSAEDQDEVISALDRLAGYGLVELLPAGACRASEAGEIFKRALSVVPEGIKFHVTPHMLKILAAASENQEAGRINWKETERACSLDTEVINETILAMRKLMFIKADKLTTAGRLLLEGMELLAGIHGKWEEIDI